MKLPHRKILRTCGFLGALAAASSTVGQSTTATGKSTTAQDPDAVQLSEFVVQSSTDTGYDVTNSVSGVRFRADLLTLPKTINVATAEFIRDIGATDLAQIVTAMTGGTVEGLSGSGPVDLSFRFRGVAASFVYRDGFRGFAPVDPISIERVEIIKGPSSFFGGQVQAGGFVNYVTKKPTGKPFSSFRQTFGSYQTFRTELENNGSIALTKEKKLLYRIALAYSVNDTFRAFEHQLKWSPFVSLSYRLFRDTTITADYQYLRRKLNLADTRPLYLTLGPGIGNYRRFRAREDFNPFGPDAYINVGSALSGVNIDHRFSPWLSLRGSLFQSMTHHTQWRPNGLGQFVTINPVTGARTLARSNALHLNQKNQDATARTDLLGNWTFSHVKLKAYAGWERVYGKFMVVNLQTPALSLAPLDIDKPVYAFGSPANATVGAPNPFYGIYDALSAGFQAELFQNTNVFGGNRHDDGYSRKPSGQAIVPGNPFKVNTPYYGVSYKITPNVAAFVSLANSFVPNSGLRFDGQTLDPLTGQGVDYGFKFTDFLGGKLSGQITAFRQELTNTLIADPLHPGFNITSGGSDQSRGIETDLSFRPVPQWRLVAGYSNIDAKALFNVNPLAIGIRPQNTPSHQVNFLSNYSFREGSLKGLGVTITGNYVGDRRSAGGATPDTVDNQLPGYTKFDLVFTYATKLTGRTANFSVGLRNVTDRSYYISSGGYGVPRTFDSSVSMRF